MGLRGHRAWLLATTLLAALCCLPARAQAPLVLDRMTGEHDLRETVALLRDASAARSLADVLDAAFEDNRGRALSFGFDSSALWLRFSAHNGSRPTRWLLELAEPSLDHVDLYVLHEDGRREHYRGGDALPFARRTTPHVNIVFELETPAYDRATYYLRVQSDDVLRTPLRAWLPDAYRRAHDRDTLLAVVFLGALLLVAVYHVGVFVMVRQRENAWFALIAVTLTAVLMSLGGQAGQLLLPNHPALANRMPAGTLALAVLAVAFFTHAATDPLPLPKLTRVLWWVALSTLGLLALVLVMPPGAALRMLCMILLALTFSGPFILHMVRHHDIPELRWYRVAWYALILSIPVAVLRYAGVIPDTSLSQNVLPIGLVAYCVTNSLALAALANRLRVEIAATNEKLVHNVEQLKQALERAEIAHENASRATKAKDEFLATMSHELRTPLNTIINIPQGLACEFARERSARCSRCDAAYLLDDADRIDEGTLCEACGQRGSLIEGTKVRYRGDDARALRFLQKIERSGQHLLQMVNGVLDYSKLEAGRFQLVLGSVELDLLLREVVEQMTESAQRKRIRLVLLSQQGARPLRADGVRLKQVLINLIANAIKFSEPESAVTVRWRSHADGESIDVEDQGIGIAPSDHERIFTSFEQVHKGDTRKYGGTGLGLSISRSLVRMHGGDLSVHSALGKGATFTVRMPHVPPALLEKAS